VSESRIYAGGVVEGREFRPLAPGAEAKMDLLELGELGYTVYTTDDLDWQYDPWIIARDDASIWILQSGAPLNGYKPGTNAIVVGKDNSWAYLTSAAASGVRDAPTHRGELERRAREAEEVTQRQEAAQAQRLRELREMAQPVTLGDLDPAMRAVTLAEAHDRVIGAGGKVELRKGDGELVVSLPPSAYGWGGPLQAVQVLYTSARVVAECLREGKPLPDVEPLPSGALAE
jgi:hypothetical protein